MAYLEASGAHNLRQEFYDLLSDFATFPASQNFFLVNIKKIPKTVSEENVNNLGIRPGSSGSTGLDFAKNKIFRKYLTGYMFLATGIDLTTETTSVNSKGKLINGLLPVGPFMEEKTYPDNDLDIQFSETNISIIDTLFRSWIQLYSVYGNIGPKPLSTDISIYFISKQQPNIKDSEISTNPIGPGNSSIAAAMRTMLPEQESPVVTKIYTYKDCIPYIIKAANVAQYNGDVEFGSVAVGFRFSKYDVRVPVSNETKAFKSNNAEEVWPDRPVPTPWLEKIEQTGGGTMMS